MFKTLQARFIAGCVALGLLIVAVAGLSLMKSNELVQAALIARLDAVEASFNAAVEQEKLRGYSLAEVSARDPDIIDAFAAGNRDLLARRLVPSFKELALSNVCVGFRLNSGASWVFRSGRRASDGTSQISTAA